MLRGLPVEIELLILSFLSPKELSTVALICKYGLVLSQDKSLWTKLTEEAFSLKVPAGVDARQYYLSLMKKLRAEQALVLAYLRTLHAIIKKYLPRTANEQTHTRVFLNHIDRAYEVHYGVKEWDEQMYLKELDNLSISTFMLCANEIYEVEEALFQSEAAFRERAKLLQDSVTHEDADFFQTEVERLYQGIAAEEKKPALSDLFFIRALCQCRVEVSLHYLNRQLFSMLETFPAKALAGLLVDASRSLNVMLVTLLLDAGAPVNQDVCLTVNADLDHVLFPLHALLLFNSLKEPSECQAAKVIITKLVEKGADLNKVAEYTPGEGGSIVEYSTVNAICHRSLTKPGLSEVTKETFAWIASLSQAVDDELAHTVKP